MNIFLMRNLCHNCLFVLLKPIMFSSIHQLLANGVINHLFKTMTSTCMAIHVWGVKRASGVVLVHVGQCMQVYKSNNIMYMPTLVPVTAGDALACLPNGVARCVAPILLNRLTQLNGHVDQLSSLRRLHSIVDCNDTSQVRILALRFTVTVWTWYTIYAKIKSNRISSRNSNKLRRSQGRAHISFTSADPFSSHWCDRFKLYCRHCVGK